MPPTTPPVTPEMPTPPTDPPAASVTPLAETTPAEPVLPERVVLKAEEYKLPEGASPELGVWAADHGLTQAQLDAATTQFSNLVIGSKNAERKVLEDLGKAHLAQWGENSKYNLTLAQRALRQNDPDGALEKALNESGYGNHPAVMEFLFAIGKSMKEGGFLKSMPKQPGAAKTAAQAMYGNNRVTHSRRRH